MTATFQNHIFKAYDIRGVYPVDIDESHAYRIGKAFITFLQEEENKTDLSIVLSSDMRLSSPQLKQEIVKGLVEQGAHVIDIGLASSPTFYFAVSFYGFDGGIIVTASHNPKVYNGCKMVRKKSIPISKETGIETIKNLALSQRFPTRPAGIISYKEGVLRDQINDVFNYVDKNSIKDFSIVADPANAMGAQYLEAFFSRVDCHLVKMNFALDGSFPAHQADPLVEENLIPLKERVKKEEADLGIATDGDGDRLFFVDERGDTVPSHIMRAVLAKIFLRKYPHATICYDIRPGKMTRDVIIEMGGTPVVTRVGHSLIKEKMREVDSVFAAESSGHFFLKFPHGVYEAPMVMIGSLLEDLAASQISFSEYVRPFKKYHHSGEINSTVDDKDEKIKEILQLHKDAEKVDFLDGVTIEYDEYWFNIRPSNTESLLRLNLEAVNENLMERKTKELLHIIRS